MNAVRAMKRSLLISAAIFALSIGQAKSAVTYDVSVPYVGGYVYSFAMTFEDGIGIKTEADLISISPTGDFSDETLTGPNEPWTLVSDQPVGTLEFNAQTKLLTKLYSADVFDGTGDALDNPKAQTFSLEQFSYRSYSVWFSERQSGQIRVTVRAGEIPSPAVPTLLLGALAGLWLAKCVRKAQ